MPKFISDAEMANLEQETPKKKFISDDEMIKLEEKPLKEPSLFEEYGEITAKPILQAAGTALGGAAGLASPIPGGTIAGGALGYGIGTKAYDILNKLITGKGGESLEGELKKSASDIQEGAAMELGGKALEVGAKALPSISKPLKGLASKVYNVPKEAMEIFKKNPKAVEEAAKSSPYEIGKKVLNDIQTAKSLKVNEATKSIDSALTKATEEGKLIDIAPTLELYKNKISEIKGVGKTSEGEKQELLSQLRNLEKLVAENGGTKFTPKDANVIKKELQNEAYFQDPTTTMKSFRKDVVGKTHAKASNLLRNNLNKEVKGLAENNKVISDILNLETNKRFQQAFSDSGIENTIKNIQSPGGNKGYIKELMKKADETLGSDIAKKSEEVFAAKYFGSPEISGFTTGRSVLGTALGGTAGAAVGGPVGAAIGSISGAALTSPIALKQFLKGSKAIEDTIAKLPDAVNKEALKRAMLLQLVNTINSGNNATEKE